MVTLRERADRRRVPQAPDNAHLLVAEPRRGRAAGAGRRDHAGDEQHRQSGRRALAPEQHRHRRPVHAHPGRSGGRRGVPARNHHIDVPRGAGPAPGPGGEGGRTCDRRALRGARRGGRGPRDRDPLAIESGSRRGDAQPQHRRHRGDRRRVGRLPPARHRLAAGYLSAVTASLPQEVREAFGRFVTCEYVTIGSRQQPIVWPVTPYYENGAPCIEVTTGLGYPKKALDAKRNPQVALLFSDLTGCGIESGINVLVQGTADVDDRDLAANRERYWRESGEKLPATKEMHPPKLIRGLFDWYYTRIYVHVRPERIFVWPNGDVTSPPEVLDSHLDEVRSGQSEEPLEPLEPVLGGEVVWDPRLEELGRRYDTAVLGWVAPDGFPLAVRLPVSLDRAARRIVLGAAPSGLPLAPGRACVTAHSHSPTFTWQENFQVRGDLVQSDGGWAVVPRKLVGGFELPDESEGARYRRNFIKSIRYYRTARRYRKSQGL